MGVSSGTSMAELMQKLILTHTNAGCANFDGTVIHAPLNITLSNVAATTFDVVWSAVPNAVTYNITVTDSNTLVVAHTSSVTAPVVSETVVGLTTATIYDVVIQVVDAVAATCDSLQYRMTTI